MRVLVAPCAFKESLTARDAARCLGEVARARGHAVDEAPLADGGEGTLEALRGAWGLSLEELVVHGPGGGLVRARLGRSGERAVVEAAEAIGLALVPPAAREPGQLLRATSTGVGELVAHAVGRGARHITLALGGTATVDGGAGMLAALGARFFDAQGAPLPPEPRALTGFAGVDLSGLLPALRDGAVRIEALADVDVPLLGAAGARMFMAQKGADGPTMELLERMLARLHPPAIAVVPGAGAAGGLGAACLRLGATISSGAERVLEALSLEERVAAADLVLTGEGRIDEQTLHGKLVAALAALCLRHEKPLVAFCGSRAVDEETLRRAGLAAVVSITPDGQDHREALARAEENLARAAAVVLSR
jgi:glycerate 2-kinase